MLYPIQVADQLQAQLKSLRRVRGLTQQQLADRLGVGQGRIAQIESAPGLVSLDQIVRVLATLGASLALTMPDEPSPAIERSAKTSRDREHAPPRLPGRAWKATRLKGRAGQPAGYLVASDVADRSVASAKRLQTLNPAFDVKPTTRGFVLRAKSGDW